jgi:hypothetical protein
MEQSKFLTLGQVAERVECGSIESKFVVFLPNVARFMLLLDEYGIAKGFVKHGNYYAFTIHNTTLDS